MSYKIKTVLLKRNVLEATLLSLLPTRFRLLSYKDLCTNKSVIYTIEIKYYGICYYDQENSTDIIKDNIDVKDLDNLKDYLKINLNKYIKCPNMNIIIDNKIDNRYDINIVLTFNDKGTLPENFVPFVRKIHFSISLYDLTWGYSMRREYPEIYKILCNNPGYTWEQYYTSITRINWLEDYFISPDQYLNVINSLLYYFAGMDEICLFDIVCKLHLNLKKIGQFKSFIHLRYNLKKIFMNDISNIDKLCFEDNWKLSDFHICELNSIHYLKLEYLIYNCNVKIDHLIASINNYNYDMFKYILSLMSKNVLNININRIKYILDILLNTTQNDEKKYILNEMSCDINNKDFLLKHGNRLNVVGYDEEDELLSIFGRDIIDIIDDLPPIHPHINLL